MASLLHAVKGQYFSPVLDIFILVLATSLVITKILQNNYRKTCTHPALHTVHGSPSEGGPTSPNGSQSATSKTTRSPADQHLPRPPRPRKKRKRLNKNKATTSRKARTTGQDTLGLPEVILTCEISQGLSLAVAKKPKKYTSLPKGTLHTWSKSTTARSLLLNCPFLFSIMLLAHLSTTHRRSVTTTIPQIPSHFNPEITPNWSADWRTNKYNCFTINNIASSPHQTSQSKTPAFNPSQIRWANHLHSSQRANQTSLIFNEKNRGCCKTNYTIICFVTMEDGTQNSHGQDEVQFQVNSEFPPNIHALSHLQVPPHVHSRHSYPQVYQQGPLQAHSQVLCVFRDNSCSPTPHMHPASFYLLESKYAHEHVKEPSVNIHLQIHLPYSYPFAPPPFILFFIQRFFPARE
jgi:hypothetical protein